LKSGLQRWLQFDGKYELTDGEPTRLVGVIADITERKALQEEADELSERLINLQEEERQLIAQELHNSTVQHLVAADLHLVILRSKGGACIAEVCDQVEASINEAAAELRTWSYLTHPPALGVGGLRSTIRKYVEGYADRSGITVKFSASAKIDRLPLQKQRALLRIVQEALGNVHRHAAASDVSVVLRRIAGRIHLTITDNGRGAKGMSKIEDGGTPRSGLGIFGIRTRARQLGGDLKMQSGPQGTRLHVVVPAADADLTFSGQAQQ
jgi:signal transduction histidine kinase